MTILPNRIKTRITTENLPLLAAVLAALVALWMIYINNGRINSDGIRYIEAARLFTEGAWKQGLALYQWPFYPALIAFTRQITQLSFQNSAYLLTIPLFATTTYALLQIIRQCGGGKEVMLAAIVLLFASNYIIRDMLSLIAREHGFWAFHLLSLLFFLRFYSTRKSSDAYLWGGFAVAASLFRLEGLTFLIFLPVVLLFKPDQPLKSRVKHFLNAHSILGMAAVILMIMLACIPGLSLHDFGRLSEPVDIIARAFAQINQIIHYKSRIMAETVLNNYLADYALPGIWLTLLAVIIGQTLGAIGWLQSALAGFAIKSSNPGYEQIKEKPVLAWWAGLGIINSVGILLSQFLLSSRMTIPTGFVILVIGSFGLAKMHDSWVHRQKSTSPWAWGYLVICCLIFVQLLVTLAPHDNRKNYEKDGVAWALKNAPPNAKIFYEDWRLMFYAGLPPTDLMTGWERLKATGSTIEDFDIVITHINRKRPEELDKLMSEHHLVLLKQFKDTVGNQLVILKRSNESPSSQ